MGLGPNWSTGTSCACNPDPKKFQILVSEAKGDYLLASIHYTGCTNFEGKKLLLFKNMTAQQLKAKLEIDPHFTEQSNLVGRFVPTSEGWEIGSALMALLNAKKTLSSNFNSMRDQIERSLVVKKKKEQ